MRRASHFANALDGIAAVPSHRHDARKGRRTKTMARAKGATMRSSLLPLLFFTLAIITGCEKKPSAASRDDDAAATPRTETAAQTAAASTKPAPGSVTLLVAYGSEKKTWLEEQAKRFEASGPKTSAGRPIHIETKAMGSGEAVQAITSGTKAHVFSPASGAYLSLLNQAWLSQAGRTKPIVGKGDPLVLSPVVIAMWKPMAEALGWPKKQLSWADLLKVNANPKGWGSVGFPEWGRFKFGHCHPEFSNSGYLAVLAEAYAGAKKTRDLTEADLDAKGTRDFLTSIEQTIVHYGKSTGFFADKMVERGPAYLSAAVLYENLVIESYAKTPAPPLPVVAVYPLEGTFWSDHPYAVLDADWVGDDEKQAADAFLAFLKGRDAQERAMALGFRPADPQIAIGAPIDAAHGVDPKQPQTVLPLPAPKTLDMLLGVWMATKNGADVVFVFDKSGSMRGKPLDEAKAGARSFLSSLDDRDQVSLLFFDAQVYPVIGPMLLQTGRPQLVARIDGVSADGGTALYDAVVAAYELATKRAAANPSQIHAIVVMTDGADENSKLALKDLESKFPKDEANVKVFTIAYGSSAESRVLAEIAEMAKGYSAKGSIETIRDVYLDMASFF
jgi:Ca-activated chloride channel family protein